MSGVTYILDDLDHYSEVYKTYTRCSTKEGVIADWVDTSFSDTVVGELSAKVQTKDPLRVLGIGSGAGTVDCAMLEQLLPSFPQIENTIVEPSEAQNDLFKKLIEEKGDALKGVTFDFRQETSDQYLDAVGGSTSQHEKFHLIHAVHVLYYATDLRKSLQTLYDLLADGGLLFIIIGSKDATVMKLHHRMNEIQKGIRPLILTDEQLKATLVSMKLPYSAEQIPRYVVGTTIFDENSPDGPHLLDFLTHSKDFWKSASDSLREGVLEYLRTPQCSDEGDGKIMFFRHWVHLTIAK